MSKSLSLAGWAGILSIVSMGCRSMPEPTSPAASYRAAEDSAAVFEPREPELPSASLTPQVDPRLHSTRTPGARATAWPTPTPIPAPVDPDEESLGALTVSPVATSPDGRKQAAILRSETFPIAAGAILDNSDRSTAEAWLFWHAIEVTGEGIDGALRMLDGWADPDKGGELPWIMGWSPDSRYLYAFLTGSGGGCVVYGGGRDLRELDVETGIARSVLPGHFGSPRLSDDGRQLAYLQGDSVYALNLRDGQSRRAQLPIFHADPGARYGNPVWSLDGGEIVVEATLNPCSDSVMMRGLLHWDLARRSIRPLTFFPSELRSAPLNLAWLPQRRLRLTRSDPRPEETAEDAPFVDIIELADGRVSSSVTATPDIWRHSTRTPGPTASPWPDDNDIGTPEALPDPAGLKWLHSGRSPDAQWQVWSLESAAFGVVDGRAVPGEHGDEAWEYFGIELRRDDGETIPVFGDWVLSILGARRPKILGWSADSQFLYAYEHAWGDGCDRHGYGYDLRQIDVDTAAIKTIEKRFDGRPILSNDVQRLAYLDDRDLVIRELSGAQERRIQLPLFDEDPYYQTQALSWAPDGQRVLLGLDFHACGGEWLHGLMILDTAVSRPPLQVMLPTRGPYDVSVEWLSDSLIRARYLGYQMNMWEPVYEIDALSGQVTETTP